MGIARDGRPERVLVVGATSSIARAMAGLLAARGARLHLVARNHGELERVGADLSIRHGAQVTWTAYPRFDEAAMPGLVADAVETMGGLDRAVLAVGDLGDQRQAELQVMHALHLARLNYLVPMALCTEIANRLAQTGAGRIVVLQSVAGDRGRRSNYVYGSAKGGLELFLQGLRSRLFPLGISVTSARLGFVDTRMTFGRKGMFLVATPQAVAEAVTRAADRGADVVYVPWFWRPIMLAVRSVPERVFKRLAV